jgi:hypothetical protein
MGLVAQGGVDQTLTFTGWKLKDSGSGNQYNFLLGFTYLIGNVQVAPNFLWQKPLEGPLPAGVAAPGRPRHILDDPFVVRSNREQMAAEILFTWDPTPGTWMYDWDSDRSEDAHLAISLGFVYPSSAHHPGCRRRHPPDGRTIFAFPGAPPAQDLWEVHSRIVSKVNHNFGFIANLYAGDAQANGSDDRLIRRYGVDLRAIYKELKITSFARINDWGPYDYHRDYNLTFPLQSWLTSLPPSKSPTGSTSPTPTSASGLPTEPSTSIHRATRRHRKSTAAANWCPTLRPSASTTATNGKSEPTCVSISVNKKTAYEISMHHLCTNRHD